MKTKILFPAFAALFTMTIVSVPLWAMEDSEETFYTTTGRTIRYSSGLDYCKQRHQEAEEQALEAPL